MGKEQSPYHGHTEAKKVLIVCPATLVDNWAKEFQRWLGVERIRVMAIQDNANSDINDFVTGKVCPVMIIGYEKVGLPVR